MRREWQALIVLLTGAIGIGFAPICVRMVEVSPVAAAFWRLLLATPLLLILAWRANGRAPLWGTDAPALPRSAWFAGVAFAADLGVWHYAIHFTSVANATLLANLAPAFIALWTVLILKQRLTGRYYGGLLLALCGAAAILGVSLVSSRTALWGDALGVLTAVFYAWYQLSIAQARRRMGTWELMFISTAVAAFCLLPVALAAGQFWPSAEDWLWLLALAVISHVLGQGFIAYALAHLAPAFSSVSLLLQPVAAALFAWWLLAETLSLPQLAGAVVVMLGILLCRRPIRVPAATS